MQHPHSLSSRRENRLQEFSQALMLTAMILPLAGILIMGGDLLARAGFTFAAVLTEAGFEVINQLPLFAAISLAYHLSAGQQGMAALSGAAACLVLNRTAAALLDLLNTGGKDYSRLNMGLLTGIIAGLTVSAISNSSHRVHLPGRLRNFRLNRILPLVAVAAAFLEGLACGAAWTYLQRGLAALAIRLPDAGAGGAFAYGFLNRLLMPLGLHHVLNKEIWFRYGEFTNQAGNLVTGDLNRFLAGDPSAGLTIAGFYEMMIFALPAIALCLIITARPRRRDRTIALMVLAGLASLASGVSEPLEYLILFTSPVLYLLLALLYGLSHLISYQLQIHCGFSFSTGLTDYLANWGKAAYPSRIWQIGLVMAVLAFAIFFLAIRVLKLPAPGREREFPNEGLVETLNPGKISAPGQNEEIPAASETESTIQASDDQVNTEGQGD
jgi:N-acetylglucosamine PTS system EIICBA or EIICB component